MERITMLDDMTRRFIILILLINVLVSGEVYSQNKPKNNQDAESEEYEETTIVLPEFFLGGQDQHSVVAPKIKPKDLIKNKKSQELIQNRMNSEQKNKKKGYQEESESVIKISPEMVQSFKDCAGDSPAEFMQEKNRLASTDESQRSGDELGPFGQLSKSQLVHLEKMKKCLKSLKVIK
ncbi:MAG: hypothetical protein OXC40_04595 [Proteobacteria bacterium]|nr:hypothetical protein [Pseudomonadota bacterium]